MEMETGKGEVIGMKASRTWELENEGTRVRVAGVIKKSETMKGLSNSGCDPGEVRIVRIRSQLV